MRRAHHFHRLREVGTLRFAHPTKTLRGYNEETWMAGTSPAMTTLLRTRTVIYEFGVRGRFFASTVAIAEISGFMK